MENTVVALGFFDGVHLGHKRIFETTVALARENGYISAACTFDTHPRAFVHGIAPGMLCTLEQRIELIHAQGIERVEVLHFDEKMANMEPEAFVELLKEKYGCRIGVCGNNFRFGKNAQGTPESLKQFGVDVKVCEFVTEDGQNVSSSRIRKLLYDGNVKKAAELLGAPYTITGKVVDGFKLGRQMGRPTMNLKPDSGLLIPENGVYASRGIIDGQVYDSIHNRGTRPTVSSDDVISIETHILGFSEMIYGKYVSLKLIDRIRGENTYTDYNQLITQINMDIERTEEILKGMK